MNFRTVPSNTCIAIDKYGQVKNNETGNILKTLKHRTGYLQLSFKRKSYSVHPLVAETWCEKKENMDVVNHLNGIKCDNFYKNLEWTNKSENVKHAYKLGLLKPCNKGKFGSKNHLSKPVYSICILTGKRTDYVSQAEASLSVTNNNRSVSKYIKNGKEFKKLKFYYV